MSQNRLAVSSLLSWLYPNGWTNLKNQCSAMWQKQETSWRWSTRISTTGESVSEQQHHVSTGLMVHFKQTVCFPDWIIKMCNHSCQADMKKPGLLQTCSWIVNFILIPHYCLFLLLWSLGENQSKEPYATGFRVWGGPAVYTCFLFSVLSHGTDPNS